MVLAHHVSMIVKGVAGYASVCDRSNRGRAMIDRKSGLHLRNRVPAKIQSNSINRGIGNLPALFAAALAALCHCVPGYPKAGLRCMVPISKSAVADVYS